MESPSKRYGIGVLINTMALIALVAALTPDAQASSGLTTCPNKPIQVQVEGSTKPFAIVVKTISVKGTSCAKANEFFRLAYNGEKISKTGFPQNYKCEAGEFKVPVGYFPQVCTKPGKTIQYAAQGG